MAFPASPTDGQIYNKKIYNGTLGAWEDHISLSTTFPTNENLLAHYSLNGDGVGGAVATYHLDNNALDSSGHGYHGTETDVTYGTGVSDQGATGDGLTSNISLPNMETGLEFTASLWLKGTINGSNNSYAFSQACSFNHLPRQIYVTASGAIVVGSRDGAGAAANIVSTVILSETVFHHVVLTQSDTLLKMYVDGVFIDSKVMASTTLFDPDSNLLQRAYYNDAKLEGSVDEVNIFDRALSQAEVTELYTNPANINLNTPTLPNDPIGHWDLDGDSNDSSGNGYHGADADVTYIQGRNDNNCASFDGTSSVINIDRQAFFNSTPRTFCAWVKRESGGDTIGQVINCSSSGQLQVMNDGAVRFGYYDSAWRHTVYSKIPFDKWAHIVATLYTDGTNFIAEVFIDGVKDSSATSIGFSITEQTTLKIGASGIGSEMFKGLIEKTKIFDRVLSDQEILALAEQTHPIPDDSLTRTDGNILSPVSYGKAKKGKGINFASNYSGLNIGKVDVGHDGTISTWFNCEGDTGRFQTILTQADTAFGYAIFLNPTTGYMTIKGAGVDTIIEVDYIDDTSHFLTLKWDSSNSYVLVDGIVVHSGSPANSLRNSDFIIGNRIDAGQIQEKSFIGSAYTNLVVDPTDMTTANWDPLGVDVTDSGQVVNGEKLWKVKSQGSIAFEYIQQNSVPITVDGDCVFSLIIRHGDSIEVKVRLYDYSLAAIRASYIYNWSTGITIENGELMKIIVIDQNTVQIYCKATNCIASSGNRIYWHSSDSSLITEEYDLFSQPQVIENTTTMFPFVDGTHSADLIALPYELPTAGKFVIDCMAEPKIDYTSNAVYLFIWSGSLGGEVSMYYNHTTDKFIIVYSDGANTSWNYVEPQFDDGTSFTLLNQRLRFIISMDVNVGTLTDSLRLIIIPQESGAVTELLLWQTDAPVAMTESYPTLALGYNSGSSGQQLDGNIEYFRVYNDILVGAVTDNATADAALELNGMPLYNFEAKENYIDDEKIYQGYNFNGVISDVRFYDRMLDTKETRAIMTRDK